jgi:hypothetical protein
MQIEIPVRLYGWDDTKKRWTLKPAARAWIHSGSVNAVGDYSYHGARLVEEVKERKTKKKADQAKADKRKRK